MTSTLINQPQDKTMKNVFVLLFCAGLAQSGALAQPNARFINLADTQYVQISPSMRSIEVENIQPDGWFFEQSKGPTDVVLVKDGKNIALGEITLLLRIDDTLSLYKADTVNFALANDDYQLSREGILYNKELGRLKAIILQSTEEISWIAFDKKGFSKNNNLSLEKLTVVDDIIWKTEGASNLPTIPVDVIDPIDNNPEGSYTMSVLGPWPWRKCYGSIQLDRAETTGMNKTMVYEPIDHQVGMQFTFSKQGKKLFNGKKFGKFVIMREAQPKGTGKSIDRHHKKKKRTKI